MDEAAAILVRALEPLENISGRTDGPGRLCAALRIDQSFDGIPLDSDTLWLEFGSAPLPPHKIAKDSRIGINPASPAAHWPQRFLIESNPHVSRPPRR